MTEVRDSKLPMPEPASPAEVLRRAGDALARCVDCCLATVVSRSGSAPATPGQKMVLLSDGTAAGTVGGGGIELAVVERMQASLASGSTVPEQVSFHLARDLAMSCGGTVELLLEPMRASSPVLLVGAGHVNYAVARLLPRLGFAVWMIDERAATLAPERVSVLEGVRTRLGPPAEAAKDVPRGAAVVVATHDHAHDVEAVVWAVLEGFAYVGGVGSRAKAVRVREELKARGASEADAGRVRMPVGTDIAARTPDELAVSIAGELIAWRAAQASNAR